MKKHAGPPALEFIHFSFQYRVQTEPTLHDINLKVDAGEKILILGPSGSGKSTLTNCINGLIPHSFPGRMEGGLSVLGEDAANLSIFDISKKVGTVLQDTDGQFVGLSAAEDIAFAAENDCVQQDEMKRRVLQTAALVDMAPHISNSPQDLSGGQKQKISMAGILIDDVEILLFDEPLANLDPASGRDAMEIIDRLYREIGKTVIIVEHRLEDVLHCPVDRIIVMNQGRIIADMIPAELLASGILAEIGIREPLYLSALRYAGISITPHLWTDGMKTIRFDHEKLKQWYQAQDNAVPPPEKEPLIEIKNLYFSYTGELPWTLENISFTIPRGAAMSLVGKNGAGKTTLAKIICGFEKPASGTILLEDRDISDLSIKERSEHIGYVMQNPNLMFSFPMIFDEAAFALRNHGAAEGEIKDKVHEILNVCGLYPFRNWPISALSYGQKKRLSVASVLIMDVDLLILDEPTAGQDFRHYTEIMEFLMRLNREQGLAILMITHDMHLMLEYSDMAMVISGGKAVSGGDSRGLSVPADILTDDAIIALANLKRTSLYDLAMQAGIADGRNFVRHFVNFDRQERENR
jgi:energy-coupling factor transport system ATP-binding protein